jgi:hypothetical protein
MTMKRFFFLTPLVLLLSVASSFAAQPVCKLAWDPSPDPTVVETILYWGTNSRSYFASNSYPAGVTNAAISNLVVNAVYYFAATAVNQYGVESEYSNEVRLLNKIKSKARVRMMRLHNGGQIRGP